MANAVDVRQTVLEKIPQQKPFRFVDEIVEIDENHVIGKYTFNEDEFFYAGHFPGNPITPGVILIETMAQIGLVALGIYLNLVDHGGKNVITLFAESEAEFSNPVLPGATVYVKSEKLFYRRGKIKAKVEMTLESGELVARGILSGVGVEQNV